MKLRVVPELYCFDINKSKTYFTDILGFSVKYERPEEQFVYLTLNGVDLMLEGLTSQSRKWITDSPEYPLGRGVNFQWDVNDIENFYRTVYSKSKESIYLLLESKSYKCGNKSVVQKQFIVQSPDGYLFRFCQDVN